MLSRKNKELTEEDLIKITNIYKQHASGKDVEEKGFAKTITKDEIEENDWTFAPERYVGILEEEVDVELTKKEIENITKELNTLFDEFEELIPRVKESTKKSIK